MALFLVDRQMYREASEVFYSHALFKFHGDNFGTTLAVLRTIPYDSLQRLRRLKFSMTVAQADGWGNGALASMFPEFEYRRIASWYWKENGNIRPEFDYQADWRAVVSFIAENTNLPRLSIIMDFASCGWALTDEGEMLSNDLDFGCFRFMYDFYIGVTTALCSLKTLEAIHFDLFPFRKLKLWLEREVMGCRNGYGSLEQPLRQGFGNFIPSWHNLDRRLEGSNYHPSLEPLR